jgi:hypothetical protein
MHTLSTRPLLRGNSFSDYHAGWLEAFGDLTRYHIVIAAMVPIAPQVSSSLTTATDNGGFQPSTVGSSIFSGTMSATSSEKHPVHLCLLPPSVGIIARQLMELEPEKDLGFLSRETEGEELCAIYHFVKR